MVVILIFGYIMFLLHILPELYKQIAEMKFLFKITQVIIDENKQSKDQRLL